MLLTLWLLTAAQTPSPPPLVGADTPVVVTLTPAQHTELITRRAELVARIPPDTGPIAATVGSGLLVIGGAAALVVSFFASFFNKPCSGFFCSGLTFDAGRAAGGYIAGTLFLAAGVATLPFSIRMLSRTRSERSELETQIEEIDAQLRAQAR